MTNTLDPRLLEILACPQDLGPLDYHAEEQLLVNPRKNIAYRIDDGIPVLLIDEAQPYGEDGGAAEEHDEEKGE